MNENSLFFRSIKFFYGAFRPYLGSYYVCIYPETCSEFAARQLTTQWLPWALIIIAARLLSCNVITSLLLHFFWKIRKTR